MTTPPDPDEIAEEVAAEIERLRSEGRLERRGPLCKVCRDEKIREMVDKLLMQNLTRAAIVSVLEPINAERAEADRITWDNVYSHEHRHFTMHSVASNVYRSIVKKRAAEVDPEFGQAVGTAVNVLSMLEIGMIKGFETLIDDETKVSGDDGIRYATKLDELTRKGADGQQAADVLARQNLIINLMREFVPAKDLPTFLARLDGAPQQITAAQDAEDIIEVEEFDPITDDEDED